MECVVRMYVCVWRSVGRQAGRDVLQDWVALIVGCRCCGIKPEKYETQVKFEGLCWALFAFGGEGGGERFKSGLWAFRSLRSLGAWEAAPKSN